MLQANSNESYMLPEGRLELQSRASMQLRLLGISNLLAAFGGGTVLGRGMGVLANEPLLRGENFLALLSGAILSLIGSALLPKKRLMLAPGILSFVSSAFSFALYKIYANANFNELIAPMTWIFFGLLVMRSGAWFLARTLRTDLSAGVNQQVSFVEFFYFLGSVLGIATWGHFAKNFDLKDALVVDILCQSVVGIVDLVVGRMLMGSANPATSLNKEHSVPAVRPLNLFLVIPLVFVLVIITIGQQIILYAFTHYIHSRGFDSFATDLIAASYFGAAAAAVVCARFKLKLAIQQYQGSKIFFRIVYDQQHKSKIGIGLNSLSSLSLTLMAIAIAGWYHSWFASLFMILIVAMSALFYEIIVLVLFDYLGSLAKKSGHQGAVSIIFGFMALIGAVALLTILNADNIQNATLGTTAFCLFLVPIALTFIRSRYLTYEGRLK